MCNQVGLFKQHQVSHTITTPSWIKRVRYLFTESFVLQAVKMLERTFSWFDFFFLVFVYNIINATAHTSVLH